MMYTTQSHLFRWMAIEINQINNPELYWIIADHQFTELKGLDYERLEILL